jgi:hypothetical protein
LLEEIKDDTPAEFSLIFIVIHLEDLLKSCDIDVVAKVAKSDGTVLVLFTYVSALKFCRKTCVPAVYLYFSCRHFGVFLTRDVEVIRSEVGAFGESRL